eukprot:jgi/Ulvmu1/4737/UM020_0021.1
MILLTSPGSRAGCKTVSKQTNPFHAVSFNNVLLHRKLWQARRCRAQQHVPESNSDRSAGPTAPIPSAGQPPDLAEQEEIARAASAVLGGAEMVLREKLEEYDAELREVHSFDDNIFYRGVNSFTVRLLTRKRAFIEKRILTIQELSRDVQSCSLDSKCTFLLKTSSDLEGLKELVDKTLDDVFVRGAVETPSEASSANSYEFWRDRSISMPAMRWSIDDEAKDLEDAIWAAAEVAGKIDGAYVQVDRKYGRARKVIQVEPAKADMMMAEALGGAMKRRFPWFPTLDAKDFEATPNRAVEAAGSAIISTAVSTVFTGFIMSAFRLSPSLDSILHWPKVLPLTATDAATLVAWTLPLAAAYAMLGGLRRLDEVLAPAGPVGAVTSTAAAAADRLQAGSRLLRYSQDCDSWDMRTLYFLSTIEMAGIYTPLVYGLLPAVLLKLGGPSMGSWFYKGGFLAPSLLQVPMLALSVATVVGAAEVVRALGDSIDQDARRDSTQDIDSLINVEEDALGRLRDGGIVVTNEWESASDAEAGLRDLKLLPQGKRLADVTEAPTSITLDWQTAAAQRTMRQMREWVNPTAVTLVAAYLCLEAQLTHELAYVAVTHFVAITVLDLCSRPWAHPSVMVKVEVTPKHKQEGAVIKVDKAESGTR